MDYAIWKVSVWTTLSGKFLYGLRYLESFCMDYAVWKVSVWTTLSGKFLYGLRCLESFCMDYAVWKVSVWTALSGKGIALILKVLNSIEQANSNLC
jgi:hypothetical protein